MRRPSVLLLLILIPLLAGCWDRLEINDLAIVDIAGIDAAPDGLRLTVSVLVPTRAQTSPSAGGSGPEQGSSAVIYTADGPSIMDAMTRIQSRLSRRLFWAHTRILIISEEFARSGVRPAMDFWSRHREPRLQMQIAVSEGAASEFVGASPRMEKLMSESIREILGMRLQFRVTMKEFLADLRSETEEPIAPRVQLFQADGGADAMVHGTAVFKDDRMIGWLDEAETRGLLWLRGEVATGVVTLDIPSGGHVSLTLIRSNTNIRPDFTTGRLRMAAHFVADDDVYESSASVDLGKEEAVQLIEELLRRDVTRRVRQTLEKVQNEFGVDILRFGESLCRAAPQRWAGGLKQRWGEVFPTVPVDITVTAHVRRTGEHGAPLGTEQGQLRPAPKAPSEKEE